MPKHVGELCHAEALFHRQASEQSLTRLRVAANSIVYGKLANAGQTCVAPDYALVQESEIEGFVAAYREAFRNSYPSGTSDEAYSAIVNQHHYERLIGLIEDARKKGAHVIEVGATDTQRAHTLAPTIILSATPEMAV